MDKPVFSTFRMFWKVIAVARTFNVSSKRKKKRRNICLLEYKKGAHTHKHTHSFVTSFQSPRFDGVRFSVVFGSLVKSTEKFIDTSE